MEFRFATRQDVPLILQFIKELAEYEKLLDEVVATEELLERWIFDKQKAEVIFALEDNKYDTHSFHFQEDLDNVFAAISDLTGGLVRQE